MAISKEEALKINNLYREIDTKSNIIEIQLETINKLQARVEQLEMAVKVDEVLSKLDKLNKSKG